MPSLGETINIEIKVNSDTKGVDDAKTKVEGFGGSLQRIGEIAAAIGLERLAQKFLQVGEDAAKFAITTAGSFEQWKISFDTMLGNSEKASQLLSQISDFAMKTPFDLPQVVEGSKRLLAYNIAGKDIIPTFQMLGDIAAGVGTDKLPQLILAFGQVKAATKLTGAELRQFSETGVPLLQALVDKANETGGVLTQVGGGAGASAKKVASLGSAAADAAFRMNYLKENGKEGSKEFQNLGEKIKFTEAKIKSFGPVGEAVYAKVKVQAKDMIDQIKDGAVSFEDVQAALQKMTEKGGKFYDLMAKQANTYNGIVSNIRDNFTRLALEIMGFDMEKGSKTFGEVKKGSLFDQLRDSAKAFYEWMNAHKEEIVAFFRNIGTVINALIRVIQTLSGWFQTLSQHTNEVIAIFTGLAAITLPYLIAAFLVWVGTVWAYLTVTLPALVLAHAPLLVMFALVAAATYMLLEAWTNNWGNIRGFTEGVINWIIGKINSLIDRLNFFIAVWNKVVEATGNKNLSIGMIGKLGAVDIGTYTGPTNAAGNASRVVNADYVNQPYGSSRVPNSSSINQTNNIYNQVDLDAAVARHGHFLAQHRHVHVLVLRQRRR
jgi:tape measure domain-containing protein